MPTNKEKIEELTARLQLLEGALQNQNPSSAVQTPQTVVVKKDPKCPIFRADCKEISAEDWLTDVTEIFLASSMTDTEKTTFLREHMQNAVFSEIRCRLRGDDYKDPEKILEIFERIYCSVVSIDELNVALYTRSQKKDESIQDYSRAILDLNQRIYRRDEHQALNDGSLKQVFINGIASDELKQHLKTTVSTDRTSTIDDLRDRAIQFERDLKKSYQNKPKSVENKTQISNFEEAREDKILKKLEKMELEIGDLKKKTSSQPVVAQNKSNTYNQNHAKNNNNAAVNKNENSFQANNSAPRRCFICQGVNHLARDCWHKGNSYAPQPRGYSYRPRFRPFQRGAFQPQYSMQMQSRPQMSYGSASFLPPESTYYPPQPAPMQSPSFAPTVPMTMPPPFSTPRMDEGVYNTNQWPGGARPRTSQGNANCNSSNIQHNGDEIINKLVGKVRVIDILLNGRQVKCQLDSGSQVTTMGKSVYDILCPDIPINEINGLLDIKSSTEHSLPYLGYIEVPITMFGKQLQSVGIIIIKDPVTNYVRDLKGQYPILLGTNILDLFPNFELTSKKCEELGQVDGSDVKYCGSQRLTLKPDQVRNVPVTVVNFRVAINSKICIESGIAVNKNNDHLAPVVIPTACNLKKKDSVVPIYNPNNSNIVIEPGQKVAKAFVAETLPPNDFSHLDSIEIESEACENEKSQLKMLLQEYSHVFAKNKMDFGFTNLLKHEIHLNSDVPVKQSYRRIPPHIFNEVRDHIQGLLEANIIRPSSSPYASPIVVVRKKSGDIRLCVDYRRINDITRKDSFPLPRVQEVVDELKGSKYFSVIDMASGYTQVPVEEEHKHITAFCVPYGLFEYNRLPFGLSNAVATYSRLMTKIFSGELFFGLLIYLDDLLIYSKNFDEHIKKLRLVFEKLSHYGLKVNPKKCQLLMKSLVYLGHKISENGIEVDPSKFEVIRNWKVPTTVKEVKSFLGFLGFYRRFIKNFSQIAAPLIELTKNDSKSKVKWNDNCQVAFNDLKEKLMSKVVLSFVDFDKPFFLEIDASLNGLGAILSQEHEGSRRPIAFASRRLHKGEVPTTEFSSKRLEFLALKWAITEKFKEYFYFQKVIVLTDSDPLSYLKRTKILNSHDVRWAAQLNQFNYEIKYRPGKYNRGADMLSRKTDQNVNTVCDDYDSDCSENAVAFGNFVTNFENEPNSYVSKNDVVDFKNSVNSNFKVDHSIISFDEFKLKQHTDDCINNFLFYFASDLDENHIKQFEPTLRKMLSIKENFVVKDGLLYYKSQLHNAIDVFRIVVPKSLVSKVLYFIHDFFGHQGITRTLSLAEERYFWVGMTKDITEYIKACDRCTRAKSPSRKIVTPMESVVASRPLEILALDFIVVEKSSDNFENILVITDIFTKFTQAVPCKDQTAETTAKVLIREWFNKYGICAQIHSDQGTNFQSELMKQIYKLYNIDKSKTCRYTPRCNGQCERFNRTMLSLLRTLENKHKRKWTQYLQELVFVYNCTPHSSTGFAPYYLMFGRMPQNILDTVIDVKTAENENVDIKDFVVEHCKKLEFAYDLANKKLGADRLRRKALYDRKAKVNLLNEGDLVYLRSHPKGRSKIQDRFSDIVYKVIKCNDNNVYTIIPAAGNKSETKTVNRAELIKCPLASDDIVNSEEILVSAENSECSDHNELNFESDDEVLQIELPHNPNSSSDETISDSDDNISLHRPRRANRGTHSNPYNLPRSVLS